MPEADKDFKGDPYERAMVGYYLALADFSDADLDNARAALRCECARAAPPLHTRA